ncbi:hypothetical protein GCM10020000_75810 [Streptomyces olivoverticillatus]
MTVTHFVPSVLGMFLRHPQAAGCTDLRYVFASGEALPVATMRHFFEVLPGGSELHNLYGPTEAAIDVTHWACRADWNEPTVPIGHPISHTTIHLVDLHLRPVPDGTPGEIVIGGRGVALGYHGRPELTAERFVASPFADDPSPRLYRTGDLGQLGPDGEIRYLGRIDSQFKLRGLRIEPEEIEAALTDVPGIAEARVLPLTDEASGEQILAAVCVPDGEAPAPSGIRKALSETLPAYLVPSGFRFVGRLPLTANGKLDRPAASALFTQGATVEQHHGRGHRRHGHRRRTGVRGGDHARPAQRAAGTGTGPRGGAGGRRRVPGRGRSGPRRRPVRPGRHVLHHDPAGPGDRASHRGGPAGGRAHQHSDGGRAVRGRG